MLRVILIFWCLLLSFIYCFPLFASLPLVFCALKFVGLWSLIPRVFNASGYFILHSCLPTSDVFDYCTLTDLGASSMPSLVLACFLIYFIFLISAPSQNVAYFLYSHWSWRVFILFRHRTFWTLIYSLVSLSCHTFLSVTLDLCIAVDLLLSSHFHCIGYSCYYLPIIYSYFGHQISF